MISDVCTRLGKRNNNVHNDIIIRFYQLLYTWTAQDAIIAWKKTKTKTKIKNSDGVIIRVHAMFYLFFIFYFSSFFSPSARATDRVRCHHARGAARDPDHTYMHCDLQITVRVKVAGSDGGPRAISLRARPRTISPRVARTRRRREIKRHWKQSFIILP